jgi:hypothetical protein
MKRPGLFLLAVVMVAGLAGCSEGSDDRPPSPAGTWMYQETITAQQGNWNNVTTAIMTINLSGSELNVTWTDYYTTRAGTYDESRGTFTASWVSSTGADCTFNGTVTDEATLNGTLNCVQGNSHVDVTWTATRLS